MRPPEGEHVRPAALAVPASTAQSTSSEQADPDLEFVALASVLGVDLEVAGPMGPVAVDAGRDGVQRGERPRRSAEAELPDAVLA